MNNLEVFKNKDFGEIRTITIDGEPYFVGKDVAEILGYTNPQKAIVEVFSKSKNQSILKNNECISNKIKTTRIKSTA